MTTDQNILLGVNVDHVATLRQARGEGFPSPVEAAIRALASGADSITAHLREDRRHIQDKDLYDLKAIYGLTLNMEMAATSEMIDIARDLKPAYCCLVPEKREELTTEGGLDVLSSEQHIKIACEKLQDAGIKVSLFIDANKEQIEAAARVKADMIEIHTGHYANFENNADELERIIQAAQLADTLGIQVNAGHGLNIENVSSIAKIPQMVELNIGFAIIARAVFFGLDKAVSEMKQAMLDSRITPA